MRPRCKKYTIPDWDHFTNRKIKVDLIARKLRLSLKKIFLYITELKLKNPQTEAAHKTF